MRVNDGVVRGERLELVRCGDERQTGVARERVGNLLREFRVCVQARAHGGAAECEFGHVGQGVAYMLETVIDLRDPAGDFLTERERRGVLQVGAADLDDVVVGARFRVERVAQLADAGLEMIHERVEGGHAHGGREHVVRRLALVHVVVGMHETLFATHAAEQFAGAVREHFVHVHVRLRARAGLPHGQREFVVMLAGNDFVGGLDDGVGLLRIEYAQVLVDLGRGALHASERTHEFAGHLLRGDLEVLQRTLRLRPPQTIGGHGNLAEGIAFHSHIRHDRLLGNRIKF